MASEKPAFYCADTLTRASGYQWGRLFNHNHSIYPCLDTGTYTYKRLSSPGHGRMRSWRRGYHGCPDTGAILPLILRWDLTA
eukprot:4663667-Pyramimonas_sp.AAC.1